MRSLLGLLKQSLGRAFRTVLVSGEVLDPLLSRNGHLYFRLTDGQSEVRAVMWKRDVSRLRAIPAPGTMVTVRASVDIYAPRGDLQLMVMALSQSGKGQKLLELARLKEKLKAEGLFDRARRQLPAFPRRIGLVTSLSGAVLHDVFQSVRARYPCCGLYLSPASVSGAGAAEELVEALERLRNRVEVVILGRGGGAFEELLPFSDERLVRAVCAFPHPVVAAVGHGSDSTLVDLVADHTAPTPTAAAVLVTPDGEELRLQLQRSRLALQRRLHQLLEAERRALKELRRRCLRSHPVERVARQREQLSHLHYRLRPEGLGLSRARMELRQQATGLVAEMEGRLAQARERLDSVRRRLHSLGPRSVLQRGFAMVRSRGELVTSVEGRTMGEELELHLADGTLVVKITEIQRPGTNT